MLTVFNRLSLVVLLIAVLELGAAADPPTSMPAQLNENDKSAVTVKVQQAGSVSANSTKKDSSKKYHSAKRGVELSPCPVRDTDSTGRTDGQWFRKGDFGGNGFIFVPGRGLSRTLY